MRFEDDGTLASVLVDVAPRSNWTTIEACLQRAPVESERNNLRRNWNESPAACAIADAGERQTVAAGDIVWLILCDHRWDGFETGNSTIPWWKWEADAQSRL